MVPVYVLDGISDALDSLREEAKQSELFWDTESKEAWWPSNQNPADFSSDLLQSR